MGREQKIASPDPVLQEYDGIIVVRDDLLEGGTKVRALAQFMDKADEFVYTSPAFGYAQIALAIACESAGKRATIFTAQRKELHLRTEQARQHGADIVEIPYGYMSNVKAKAAQYARQSDLWLLPFGLDFPEFVSALADVAKAIKINPREVWTVAGSGVLSRALQQAWPTADFHAVRIGARPNAGRARVYNAPERYEQGAKMTPPFPSCSNYDAKAWQFIKQYAQKGALFWSVGK